MMRAPAVPATIVPLPENSLSTRAKTALLASIVQVRPPLIRAASPARAR